MKITLLISFLFSFGFYSGVFAQDSSKNLKPRPTKVESSKEFNPYKRDYLYETAKVLKFFKSGSIPADFPKATSFSSGNDYKKAVMGYASMHYDLFNHDELAKRDIVIKKINNYNSEKELRDARKGDRSVNPEKKQSK